MLSKSLLKLITSLQQKKYRIKNGLFVVEGIKAVNEFLNSSFELDKLFCIEQFQHQLLDDQVCLVSEMELKKISNLKTPNQVLALFKIPATPVIDIKKSSVVLDGVNDPGNLGTIIRLCDWFGVEQLICSEDTVDCFNSKVVQSTMGSISRVKVLYTSVCDYLQETKLPIYAAVMNGEEVYKTTFNEKFVLVMGNEANGIHSDTLSMITHKITIPQFGTSQTESLNVATATAILLNEIKRF